MSMEIKVERKRFSVTQGEVAVYANDNLVVQYGDDIKLGGPYHQLGGFGSIHEDAVFARAAVRDYPKEFGVKRFCDWERDLKDFLSPGDLVDGHFVEYFQEVLPPACDNFMLIQLGEPSKHIEGQPVFPTLVRKEYGVWRYAGLCFIEQSSPAEA